MLKQKVARCFYVLLLLLIITNFLFADKIDVKTARTVAYNFYLSNVQQKSDNKAIFISKEFVVSGEDQPLFYIFNFADEKGFVLVSAYDICQPILGYSFVGNYKKNNPAPGFDYLVNSYKEQIIKAVASNFKADKSVGFLWDAYKKGVCKQKKKSKSVEPLIKSKWGQGCYYNDSCPAVSGGPCSKAQAGCVATALAQIMRFYNFPARGSGSHSYKHSSFGILN
ncbi:MAG: Spi family protease inhibitor, partial [Bacteroidales bacterium]|nr:Spi family protease inhibitor [Bacteroidales bacterium]